MTNKAPPRRHCPPPPAGRRWQRATFSVRHRPLILLSLCLTHCSPDRQSDALSHLASCGYDLSVTSFHHAAASDDVSALDLFLQAGVKIDLPSHPSQPHTTALRSAVAAGSEASFRWLLQAGASLPIANSAGTPLLQLAVANGHLGLVDALLPTYPTLTPDQRDTLLRLAIELPTVDVLDHLLRTNDRPLVEPIRYAAKAGRVGAMDLLHLAGADPHASHPTTGDTPLHLAAAAGHAELVEFLLRLGVNRFPLTPSGILPAELALGAGHASIAARLWLPPTPLEREIGVLPGSLSPDHEATSTVHFRPVPPHEPGSPRTLHPLKGARIGHQSGLIERPPLPERLSLQTLRSAPLPLRVIQFAHDHALFEDLHHPGLGEHVELKGPIGQSGYTLIERRPISLNPAPAWIQAFAVVRHDATGTLHAILPGIVSRSGPLCATLHVIGTDEFYEAHVGDTFHFTDLPHTPLQVTNLTSRSLKIHHPRQPFELRLNSRTR